MSRSSICPRTEENLPTGIGTALSPGFEKEENSNIINPLAVRLRHRN